MKTTTQWALVTGLAALSLMATACSAADSSSEADMPTAEAQDPITAVADEPRDGHKRLKGARLIEKFDKDGNGTVELAELPEHKQKWLAKADSNGDGKLTADELHAAKKARHGGHKKHGGMRDPEAMMKRLDTDGSGALEASELPGRMSKLLDRADANKDGKVSADELKQHAAERKARWEKHAKGSNDAKQE